LGLQESSVPQLPFYGYEKVVSYVQALVNAGEYTSGHRLPKQAELAHACQVSINSVRDGLKRLEEQGLITLGQGRHGGATIN
jgi:GntR family transcriptional repressor for pyruvate dehydrogenase complex